MMGDTLSPPGCDEPKKPGLDTVSPIQTGRGGRGGGGGRADTTQELNPYYSRMIASTELRIYLGTIWRCQVLVVT